MDHHRVDWYRVVTYSGMLAFSVGFWWAVGAGCNALVDSFRANHVSFAPVCEWLVNAGGFPDHATCIQAFLDAPSA